MHALTLMFKTNLVLCSNFRLELGESFCHDTASAHLRGPRTSTSKCAAQLIAWQCCINAHQSRNVVCMNLVLLLPVCHCTCPVILSLAMPSCLLSSTCMSLACACHLQCDWTAKRGAVCQDIQLWQGCLFLALSQIIEPLMPWRAYCWNLNFCTHAKQGRSSSDI